MAIKSVHLVNHREAMGKRFFRGTAADFTDSFRPQKGVLEKIIQPAVKHPSGEIFSVQRPGRHHHVFLLMDAFGMAGVENTREQGFITSHGRYLDRTEALRVARMAEQIKIKTEPTSLLFSEDLW